MFTMKLAAIDIGSNAARIQITRIIEYEGSLTFKRVEYIRFPLRLGMDVFKFQRISPKTEEKFFKLMHVFKTMMELYEVDHYYACGTSAMREAINSSKLVKRFEKDLDLKVNVISGQDEADLINNVVGLYLDHKCYLHVDVGGGSTELNLYYNQEKINSASFPIGSVRSLEFSEYTNVWNDLIGWIKKNIKKDFKRVTAIGTGGNIHKIYDFSKGNKERKISLRNLEKIQGYLKSMSVEERINKLQLNPDRADVIIPASDIYIEVMKVARTRAILIPDLGLKDGINYYLYQKYYPKKGKVLVRN